MQPIQGIHHITALASDPQANVDFYHNVLGQRLIKTTVNFDDPGTYHLYYGDEVGTPGTLITFFPWGGAPRGHRGSGEIGAVAYSIRPESVDFWYRHLTQHGISVVNVTERFGSPVLTFTDPDGMPLELIGHQGPATFRFWADGPISEEHALRGFHSATLWLAQAEPTAELLTGILRYEKVAQDHDRWRFRAASDDIGQYIDLLIRPELRRGLMGAGSVHHMAFRTIDDSEQLEYQGAIAAAGHGVTPVRDRQYFRSIYFREPGGVLFEIATNGPGFLYDEPVERLGMSLKLPAWLEPQRALIERSLPPLTARPVVKESHHG
jgi:glyoxalase family protein